MELTVDTPTRWLRQPRGTAAHCHIAGFPMIFCVKTFLAMHERVVLLLSRDICQRRIAVTRNSGLD